MVVSGLTLLWLKLHLDPVVCRECLCCPKLLWGTAVTGPGPVKPHSTPVFSCRCVRKAYRNKTLAFHFVFSAAVAA